MRKEHEFGFGGFEDETFGREPIVDGVSVTQIPIPIPANSHIFGFRDMHSVHYYSGNVRVCKGDCVVSVTELILQTN